ncbi:MAG: hypothetical protein AB7I30_17520, partial [Isosphaeraceae bacterium]
DSQATCGLVAGLLGLVGNRTEHLARVDRPACESCCSTFPPTPSALNPVVASLLYAALAEGESLEVPLEKAEALRTQAAQALNAALDGDQTPSISSASPASPLTRRLGVPRPGRHGVAATWAVGVTTAPRREPTLDRCLESLAAAGWDHPRLFIDAPVDLPPRAALLPQTYRDVAVGAWPNYLLALQELVLRQPRADAYLIVQDDALFYQGESIRPYLERHVLWPGTEPGGSIVSLYCASAYTRSRPGWHRLRGRWAWGALAFIFPNALARAFLMDRTVFAHRWIGRNQGLAHIDVVVGRWARRRRIGVWYPCPSLVQHIGETSSLWEGARALGDRRARRFLGDTDGSEDSSR